MDAVPTADRDRMAPAGCMLSLVERLLPARGPDPNFFEGRNGGGAARSPPGHIIHPIAIFERWRWLDDGRSERMAALHPGKLRPAIGFRFWQDGRRPASTGAEWKGLSRWMAPATPPPGSHYSPTSPKNPWGRLMDDERLVRDTLSSYKVGAAVKDSAQENKARQSGGLATPFSSQLSQIAGSGWDGPTNLGTEEPASNQRPM